MTDRDQDERRDSPEDSSPTGSKPATWAGRQRGPAEEAGEHEQVADEEPRETAEAPEADEPEAGEPEVPETEATEADGDEGEGASDGSEDEESAPATAERLAQETVEADTLAMADREAAREAALAGLRARAAENATKHGTESITAPPPKKPSDPKPQTDGHEPSVPAPPAAATPEAEEKPPKRGMWPGFVAGSLLIIVAMATATSVSLFFFINGVLADFHPVKGVQNELVVAHAGQPQTILILGSDRRPDETEEIGARSDTTILLRIASDQITVLSIPRDLEVNIPGHGPDKFNAAYTYGGPRLTLKVVKQLTGIEEINHVVNVDFTGFANAVNAIGCVYVDVDHHYYHSNYGLAASEQYAEIDIPAGYQRMCGYNALQYVRYRHDDNDLVRSARQQDFLRELRQELPASRILDQRIELIDTLRQYVTLDIRDASDVIALVQLVVAAKDAPVVQVHFPANLGGPTAAYVTASKSAIRDAVAKFEGTAPAPIPSETSTDSSPDGGDGGSGGASASGGPTPAPAPTLIDATASAQDVAAQLEATKTKGGDTMLDFPLYFPTKLAPDSTILGPELTPQESRAFLIDGPGDEVYRGYKFVAQMPTDGYTAYYGVSGTSWKDPPILANPDETRTIDGRDYLLSWDGPQLRLIGWKTDQGSYWVDNTLLNVLAPGQMFAIAESTQKYTG